MDDKITFEELRQRIKELENAITAGKRAEEALRESEQTYRTFSEKSLAGIYVVQDGKFQSINVNAASYAGYTPDELIGRKSDSIVHPEDRLRVKRNAREMLNGRYTSPHDFRIVTKQGKIRWVMETVTSISYEGRPAILGNSMDITKRKQTEDMLQESENLYRTIFENTGTATIIIEEDTIISLVNTEFEKLSGYFKKDWEGKRSWTEFVVKKDLKRMKEYHYLRRIDPDAAPRNYEFGFIDKQGNFKDIFITISMIPGTTTSVASLLDVTERKQAEKEVKKRGREVQIKSRNLEEVNTALKVLLKRREEDKKELEEKVLLNVRELAIPYIEKLKISRLNDKQITYVSILEKSLNDIISPFLHNMTLKYSTLTPKEIQVANLVKEGKNSKDIAELMNLSLRAVDFHRGNIRNKLGMKSKKANLQSFLLTHL